MRDHIQFVFRGRKVMLEGFSPVRSLLDWLREDNRATGTKEGCNEGDCGACTVVLARLEHGRIVHRPVNACITFLGMADGAEILTVEDLVEEGRLHPIQQAMVDKHGSQCGFCTPGIVMSLFALGKEEGDISRDRINDQLAGNLCRCTGYRPIVDAAMAALGEQRPDHLARTTEERMARLEALDADSGAMVASSSSPHPEPVEGSGAAVGSQAGASFDKLRMRLEGDGFFAAPRTLPELLALSSAHPDATILAGATDVGLWITKQFRPIRKLIWLGRVDALKTISRSKGRLVIGGGVSHEAALPHLAALSTDLGELGRRFGSKQVRAQGTIGGNIANGSPIGDWAPAFIALGAELELAAATFIPPPCGEGGPAKPGREGVASPSPEKSAQPPPDPALRSGPPSPQGGGMGTRHLPLETFFIAYGQQDRKPGEIVSAIRIPMLKSGEHFRCLKLSKRFDEDISALMGAFRFSIAKGRITAARIAFGGMAATPKRAPKTEAALVGLSLAERESWAVAAAQLAEDFQPIDDMRASARYRQETAKALLIKALMEIAGDRATRVRPTAVQESLDA